MNDIILPVEAADSITIANLSNMRNYLQSELDQWKANPKNDNNPTGYWLHPEDVGKNAKMIMHLDEVIKYFGGDIE